MSVVSFYRCRRASVRPLFTRYCVVLVCSIDETTRNNGWRQRISCSSCANFEAVGGTVGCWKLIRPVRFDFDRHWICLCVLSGFVSGPANRLNQKKGVMTILSILRSGFFWKFWKWVRKIWTEGAGGGQVQPIFSIIGYLLWRCRGVYSMHLQQYLNAPSQQIQGEPDEDHN